jgi:hypothetical protein
MKKYLPFAAVLILALASISFSQEPTPSPAPKPKPRMSKAQLLRKLSAEEKKLWEAWKNKDSKPFMAALFPNTVVVGESGVVGAKADIVKELMSAPCEIQSFELSDWKLTMLDSDAALLTYKGTAQGTCAGTPIPAVWASSVWINQSGRWRAAFHQETPVKP